jgi:hypothetical protein
MSQMALKIRQLHRSLRIDLAQGREMAYLCGMKFLISFIMLLMLNEAALAQQLGYSDSFFPPSQGFSPMPVGSKIVFKVHFSWANEVPNTYVNTKVSFLVSQGVSVEPTEFYMGNYGSDSLTVTITSDTVLCLEPGVVRSNS